MVGQQKIFEFLRAESTLLGQVYLQWILKELEEKDWENFKSPLAK